MQKKCLLSGRVVFRARFEQNARSFLHTFSWILGQKVGRKLYFLDYNGFFFLLILFTFFRDSHL